MKLASCNTQKWTSIEDYENGKNMTMDSDRNLGFKIVNIPEFKIAHTGIYNVVRS